MEPIQAFLLGIMVALTPSLIVLAVLLRNAPPFPDTHNEWFEDLTPGRR